MVNVRNLVVGAGFSGSTIARKLAEDLNEKVVVIDAKSHIGGNSYDYRDENGIMIHKYGSHIFHTNLENVWKFVSRFTSFNTYMHKVIAVIDGIETTIPFNFRTLYDVFPESLAKRLEKTVIAKEYSETFVRGKNERYYPIPNENTTALYNKYKDEADKLNNVYFLGRLGDYKYYDMDKAINRSLELFESISGE